MSVHAWESFIAKLLAVGVDAAQSLFRIVLIVAAAYIFAKLLRASLSRMETFLIRATEASEKVPGTAGKRVKTLVSVSWTISSGILWFMVVLLTLGQIGVNVGPILAGAGVVGLAVGFGAQHLVRDLVSGFFILLENQIRVGDAAIINGTAGTVEAISFRTVALRNQAGVVYIFPNGSINSLANATMDWSAYVIDVAISYKEDPDRAMDVMRQVAQEMHEEETYKRAMLQPIEIFGVDNFTDTAIIVKARFRTEAARQNLVGREFRRRLNKAFEDAGIELPPAAQRPVKIKEPAASETEALPHG